MKYRATATAAADPVHFEIPESGLDFNTAVDQFENNLILRALEKTNWNRNQAALLLRLNRTTLVEKIKKKGLRPPGDTADSGAEDSQTDSKNYFRQAPDISQ